MTRARYIMATVAALTTVIAGNLRAAANEAIRLVRTRKRTFTHASAERPADDPQLQEMVGRLWAQSQAAEALVLAVRHCPGHTPGHVVFFHAPSQIAIVGDVLFAGSIGRTDFPGGNHAQLIASIRERLFPLGDEVTFLPGHGPTSTFGAERRTNPFVADELFRG